MTKTTAEKGDFTVINYESNPDEANVFSMGFHALQKFAHKIQAENKLLRHQNDELLKFKNACLGNTKLEV